jgi:hypothetical protein
MPKRAAFVVGLAVVAAASAARAEDDPACAKYQDPMAYNACLARHGPRANDRAAHEGHAFDGWSGRELSRSPAEGRRWRPVRRRGRVHIEFPVE